MEPGDHGRDLKAERDEAEKEAGAYYDGPSPPLRYAEAVVQFAVTHVDATVGEWAAFASRLARRCYTEGYVRGYEWRERQIDQLDAAARAQAIEEDTRRHDWSWTSDQVPTSEEMAAKVGGSLLDDLPDDEARARYLDAMGRYDGTFRIVVSR